jgi:hypothetical protein
MSCLYCDSVLWLTFELLIYERHCLRPIAADDAWCLGFGAIFALVCEKHFSLSIVHFNNIVISGYCLKENTLKLCHENKPVNVIWVSIFFFMTQQPLTGHGFLVIEASRSHSDTSHSVGLLWTSVQPVAQTSTWQQTTDKRQTSMPQQDSNPQSQQTRGRRPTP